MLRELASLKPAMERTPVQPVLLGRRLEAVGEFHRLARQVLMADIEGLQASF
jgi:hypothetical protein